MQNGNKTPDKESLNDEKLNEIKLNEIITSQSVCDTVFIPIFHHIFYKSYNHFVKAVCNSKNVKKKSEERVCVFNIMGCKNFDIRKNR